MPDKCLAHDSCMKEIRDDLDEIKDLLRNGHVIHAQHEQRLTILENDKSGWDFRKQILRLILGLAEKAILLIVGLAAWAIMKGGLTL